LADEEGIRLRTKAGARVSQGTAGKSKDKNSGFGRTLYVGTGRKKAESLKFIRLEQEVEALLHWWSERYLGGTHKAKKGGETKNLRES